MGKPVEWTMGELSQMILNRQQHEFGCNIAVDGAPGNGKSTFAYKLFTRCGKFNPERDIVFSREDVMMQMEQKKEGFIDADEMINSAHNRDFFSGDQKLLIKMFNMYRDNRNVLAGSVPFFYDLDPQVRKFIKIRITVVERGMGVIQIARTSLYSNDPWETQINRKIEEEWIKDWRNGKATRPRYHKLTTFVGYIFFGELTPEQKARYLKIKAEKRNIVMQEHKKQIGLSEINKDEYFDSLLTRLKENDINKEGLLQLCKVNKWKYTAVIRKLNTMLIDEGSDNRVNDYLRSATVNKEKDGVFTGTPDPTATSALARFGYKMPSV